MTDTARQLSKALTVAREAIDLVEHARRHTDAYATESLEESLKELRKDLWEAEGRITWLTSAPEAYDGFGTISQPTRFIDGKGEPYRKVRVLPSVVEWQKARYLSGSHAPWTPAEFRDLPAEWRVEVPERLDPAVEGRSWAPPAEGAPLLAQLSTVSAGQIADVVAAAKAPLPGTCGETPWYRRLRAALEAAGLA
jgi:hypothetical protein